MIRANGRACLADFGLSTVLAEVAGNSYVTTTIRGNARWAAAELFEVDEEDVSLSIECDIYSFGSITLQASNLNLCPKDLAYFAHALGIDLQGTLLLCEE